jgi:hypothetical protein
MIRYAKKAEEKIGFSRRQWQINPATRVKDSAKKYSRPRLKDDEHKSHES